MEAPFVYGKLAVENNFIDREEDCRRLAQNFISLTNTILISPRRWGKSSLVNRVAQDAAEAEKSLRVVFIDLFNVRSEEEFYKELLEKVILAVSGQIEEVISNIKRFFKQWVPQISFSPDSQQEFSLSMNWNELKKQPDEVLNLAERMAQDKDLKIVICIDEFQNIAYYDDPLAFQKKLRSHWQKHQKVSYCLYGSKRHMMIEVFASPSMPFYKFGDLMFLSKIEGIYWTDFIVERFESTGKSIKPQQAAQIAELVENHPYYVQQLAQLVWLRTKKTVRQEELEQAYENLILQLSMLFQNLTETLPNTQINFIRAVLEGVSQISSKEAIEHYKLGTSANVTRIRKALISKEVIDDYEGKIIVLDPLYSAWLRKYYFRKSR